MSILPKTKALFKDKLNIKCPYKLPKMFLGYESSHWNNVAKKYACYGSVFGLQRFITESKLLMISLKIKQMGQILIDGRIALWKWIQTLEYVVYNF